MEAQAEFRFALFAVSFWEYVSKIEELSTPVQVRGIGCLAGYADSWAGRVVFERLTYKAWGLLPIFGVNDPALWHSLAHFSPKGAFSPLLATARNKKEKPSQYVTATALKSGARAGLHFSRHRPLRNIF